MQDPHHPPAEDVEEEEGRALYFRLREEARAHVLATASALAALPLDVSRRTLITVLGLIGVILHDGLMMGSGQPPEATITAQAVAVCVDAVCAMTGIDT